MNSIQIESAGIYNSQISCPNTKKSTARRTSMFELELPTEDCGISYIDDSAMPVKSNTLIFAKPNQLRSTSFPFRCLYVHFRVFDEHLLSTLNSLPDFVEARNPNGYEEAFNEFFKYCDTYVDHDEIMLNSLLLKLIYMLCSDADCGKVGGQTLSDHSVEKALKYISENIDGDLSLAAVARHVHLSPTYFHSHFKRAVSKTLHEYVEETRIKHSINLMLTTDFSLTQIAYKSGFSSQSYYSSLFKRRLGCTPRKYIKRLNDRYGK